jgi:hypothetical protein
LEAIEARLQVEQVEVEELVLPLLPAGVQAELEPTAREVVQRAAIRAVWTGWRKEASATSGPNAIRRVWLASQASETQSSSDSGSGGVAFVTWSER